MNKCSEPSYHFLYCTNRKSMSWYPGKFIVKGAKKLSLGSSKGPEEEHPEMHDLGDATDTLAFLATVGHACNVASFLFGQLPAPFAATGLLFTVVLDRINKCQKTEGHWKDLKIELQLFVAESEGPVGFTELLKKCGSVTDKDLCDAAEEIKRESLKLSEVFAEMLTKVQGFFNEGKASIIFNASSSGEEALKCYLALQRYHSLLQSKLQRFGILALIQVNNKVDDVQIVVEALHRANISQHYEKIKHLAFKELWEKMNFGLVVEMPMFIAAVRDRSECTTDTVDSFGAFMRENFPTGSISPQDINKVTEGLSPAMSLTLTIEALLPKKEIFAEVIDNPVIQALWKHNQKWEYSVSINEFGAGTSRYATSIGAKGIASLITSLDDALKLRFSDGTVNAAQIGSLSEKINPAYDFEETLRALLVVLTPTTAPLPPAPLPLAAPSTPQKSAPPNFVFDPAGTSPKSGKCVYCDKPLLFGSINKKTGALEIGAHQKSHAPNCPKAPF